MKIPNFPYGTNEKLKCFRHPNILRYKGITTGTDFIFPTTLLAWHHFQKYRTLTLLHSEGPKLYTILAFLSAVRLNSLHRCKYTVNINSKLNTHLNFWCEFILTNPCMWGRYMQNAEKFRAQLFKALLADELVK